MTNIEKIKDMMTNNLWMEAIDSVTELIITAANLQEEVDSLKEQNEAIINERDELLKRLDTIYKSYQSALSDKVALIEKIKDLEALEALVGLYRQKAITANGMYHHELIKNKEHEAQKEKIKDLEALVNERNENDELKNKVIRFDELVSENYRLRQSINDLKANNKELKAKIKEPVDTITINPCCDLEEAYSPDNNTIVNIKNLYLTNNYFSEEDENNG